MYVGRLRLNPSRLAVGWCANPYRVHQRLKMAFDGDPRLLFRIEDEREGTQIIVQATRAPKWDAAFADFLVLSGPPEHKPFAPCLSEGRVYRFRLLANPTVKRNGRRLGLLREEDQRAWLARKLADAGGELVGCVASTHGLRRSEKNPHKDASVQTHLAVLFDGALRVKDAGRLCRALETGIGAAKGYGFGLLSLAPIR